MKREILFRGKRADNGEMVYGNLMDSDSIVGKIVDFDGEYFIPEFWYKVDPETVGQFTGLTDKNGTKIFEGDIVSISYSRAFFEKQIPSTIGVVRYLDCLPRFMIMGGVEPNCVAISSFCNTGEEWEVIGNIYDNHELIKP